MMRPTLCLLVLALGCQPPPEGGAAMSATAEVGVAASSRTPPPPPPTVESAAAPGSEARTTASALADPPSAELAAPAPTASVPGVSRSATPERADDPPASEAVAEPSASESAGADAPRFPKPDEVRGLYVNAWAAGSSRRMGELIELARRTEINTFVIDVKDASGYLSHASRVPLANEIGATEERRIRDLPALLDRLEAEGIYPIARIVVVKDPILAAYRPEYAVQDTAGGVWIDSKQIVWLNLYAREVWDYHVQIAREVAEMGFPEIQWDYIRFPDAPEEDLARAVFTGAAGRPRVEAVRGFLQYARRSLSEVPARSTADVFGVTTSYSRDIGIGQLWEHFIDVVDVALPMVYPSHYWEGSYGFRTPNAHPYEVVRAALRDAVRRSAPIPGAGSVLPWIQDFSLGQPPYGGAEVRAQIQAAYDVGIREWVLWNPSSRYTETALEPVGGFVAEPFVRVAGVVAPVSRRYAVLDSVAALAKPAPRSDSIPPGGSAPEGAPPVDTLAIAPRR